jgi:DNA-binding transcriptional regulator YhcF (GntR family)
VPEIQQVLPKYLQIAGHIRDQIVRGDLKAGDEVARTRDDMESGASDGGPP